MIEGKPVNPLQTHEEEWVTFQGGELQGQRPRVLCPLCRAKRAVGPDRQAELSPAKAPLCFRCYRVALERERIVNAAAKLDTASSERFRYLLPFDPVNRVRLERLRVERAAARKVMQAGVGHFGDRRRQAQITARHALGGISTRALHALELQFPESWLPFVIC